MLDYVSASVVPFRRNGVVKQKATKHSKCALPRQEARKRRPGMVQIAMTIVGNRRMRAVTKMILVYSGYKAWLFTRITRA